MTQNSSSTVARNARLVMMILIGLATLAVALYAVGDKSGMFSKSIRFKARYPSVSGLTAGADVWLAGLKVGYVESVDIAGDGARDVEAALAVENKYQKWIRADTVASIESIGLLGHKIVNLSIGSIDQPEIPEGSEIKSRPAADFSQAFEQVGAAVQNLAQMTDSLRDMFSKIASGEGALGKLIADKQTATNLESTLRNLDIVISDIAQGRGTLGRLMKDEELYKHLNSIAAKIDSKDGTVGKFIADGQLYDNVNRATLQLQQILAAVEAGKGSARVLTDQEMYDAAVDTVNNLRTLTQALTLLVEDIKANPKKYFEVKVF